MDLQQKFGARLLSLLEENNISQGEFAKKMNCSRQSINFYILGRRSPDIVLAAKMAKYLGVSCDYLIGFSDFRADKEANLTVQQAGLSEGTMKFFAGQKLMATGMVQEERGKFEALGFDYEHEVLPYNMAQAQITLDLLNRLISHDQFGVLLQYIKKYRDICHDNDGLSILQDFILAFESPATSLQYGDKNNNVEMIKEFYLHMISKLLDEIVKDIVR